MTLFVTSTTTRPKDQAGLPSRESTKSYWHTQPSEKLLGHRSSPQLPATADVVVVGSGITGAFAARELVHGGREVLMLEAREACWGATGRLMTASSRTAATANPLSTPKNLTSPASSSRRTPFSTISSPSTTSPATGTSSAASTASPTRSCATSSPSTSSA
ncbi:hypothetical protein G7046_g9223 [Stylonectria norvegica]|nr:hypothetical protein G7046_g9223 [Stylonectria norvegica]